MRLSYSPLPASSVLCSLLVPLLTCSVVAHAELGGNVSNLAGEQVRIKATLRSQSVAATDVTPGYSVHELTTEIGTVVREYADDGGTVFAVTWEGPVKPDLQTLLGPYFQTMLAAPKHPGGGPLQVSNSDLVIFSGGHPRAFFGRAYLPASIPAGVNIDVLP